VGALEEGPLSSAFVVASASRAVAATPVNKWIVALSISFGALMASIDTSIVNVALPYIRGSVGATVEEITWVATSYIIATVVVMPLTGFLGSLFGQKRLYLVSLVLFVASSMLCGVARSLPTLVAFRALQGLAAGVLLPSQQAILRQAFPPGEQGMAMSMYAMVVSVGPAVGPTLGGWITDNYSWPWIFYVNVPVGLVGTTMSWRFLHEPPDVVAANRTRAQAQKKNFDAAGIVLMCICVSTLQYVLEEGQRDDWFDSKAIAACSAVSAVSFVAFVVCELTAAFPVVNLRLFQRSTFASATVISAVVFAMLTASMFLLPVFMQEFLGFSATQAGIALVPRALAMMVLMPIVGRIYHRVPPAVFVGAGTVLYVLGSYELSHLTLQSSAKDIDVPLFITGVGYACLMVPLVTLALESMERTVLADAAGLNSFARQIGASLGLAIFVTLLSNYRKQAYASLAADVTPLRPEVMQQLTASTTFFAGHGMDPVAARQAAIETLSGRVALQANVLAFEKVFLLQAVAFVVVLPLVFLLRAPRHDAGKKVMVDVE
jgi:MFS transporter, DHA2 family, multidrug resistance protein